MNTLYIDCRMGVSGGKLLGALTDIFENPDSFVYDFNKLGIDGVSMRRIPDAINGIKGSMVEIRRTASSELDPYADEIDDDYAEITPLKRTERTLRDVEEFINATNVTDTVKKNAVEVYRNIAKASSLAGNKNIDGMIMRKTGSRDIIATVIGVCMAIDRIKPEKIISTAVAVGEGYAHTSRGRLPIPTPDIEFALGRVPYISGIEPGELCSLEGAALVEFFADEFGDMPDMTDRTSGAGFGRRTFKNSVNCTRVVFGNSIVSAHDSMTEIRAETFDMDRNDIYLIGARLEELGAKLVYVSDIYGCNGNRGLR